MLVLFYLCFFPSSCIATFRSVDLFIYLFFDVFANLLVSPLSYSFFRRSQFWVHWATWCMPQFHCLLMGFVVFVTLALLWVFVFCVLLHVCPKFTVFVILLCPKFTILPISNAWLFCFCNIESFGCLTFLLIMIYISLPSNFWLNTRHCRFYLTDAEYFLPSFIYAWAIFQDIAVSWRCFDLFCSWL